MSGSHTKIPTAANGWDDGTEHSARRFQHGKVTVELMPEGYILLGKEIATGYHPIIEKRLAGIPPSELDERLLVIATYCGVVVDGFYTIQERSNLCAILAGRLKVLRDITKGEPPQNIIMP